MFGCSINGSLNVAEFSKPMPWIGIYIAAASLACAVAMAVDAVAAFRYRRLWFPSRFFALNATSLTIIAVAVKLSVDLNTPMPRRQDQLAKLSSSVLICTVMGNLMPSLGAMENKELLSNMIALAILVITSIVNICMQLGTGVIYTYRREHAFVMLLMLLLLMMLSFSAAVVPTTKCYLEMKYCKKHELALKESSSHSRETVFDKLKEDLMKYGMMAHTGNPQFVVGRSVTCAASGALCLLSAMTLVQAMLRSYLMPGRFEFCNGESDYKWSSMVILIAQNIAVGVGTIAPAFRWFIAIKFKCPKRGNKSYKDEFKLEKHWIQCFIEIKECPLGLHIPSRHCRKLTHDAKRVVLEMLTGIQVGIVLGSKVVRLISILFMSRILLFCDLCCELRKKLKLNISVSTNDLDSSLRLEGSVSKPPDLSRYVLHLEGEEELVHTMMRNNCDATECWIKMGKKNQPKHLIQLLEETPSRLFGGVMSFDSDAVPPLDSAEPPNNWALPIVTLASLGLAIPNIDPHARKRLLQGVREGLTYVNLVEERLCAKQELVNTRKAASIVFLEVDLYHKWLDVDLHKLSLQGNSMRDVLEALGGTAKNVFVEFKALPTTGCLMESPSMWPVKVLAAYSMYRISETLLLDCKGSDCDMSSRIFEKLARMISDIIAACLTNLEHVMFTECCCSGIEERKESVRFAALLLGRTVKVMNILNQRELPYLDSEQLASIDEWRASGDLRKALLAKSFTDESELSSLSPGDLYLSIQDSQV
ncbi:uncharacterized protein LOC115736895 [Rhodamnia argentea]|uniref:Uncharacterized protein LOC115736895 n=1 Tax=Rhodamnia argentea TaxID=178133 RepID=A0A8B8NRS8_9MYRT|nr:uncharacterized protein LOC115736895 [Rhodamnia argentea]